MSTEIQSQLGSLIQRFEQVRQFSQTICEPLEIEDFVIQSMPDVSPMRWHLAHTTWFFETFLLKKYVEDYQSPNPQFEVLFNSYYNSVGEQFPRFQRGFLSRPTVSEIFSYRAEVDKQLKDFLDSVNQSDAGLKSKVDEIEVLLELGLHHEQQHQELMLTDIKHVFSCNPLFPVYRQQLSKSSDRPVHSQWLSSDSLLGKDGIVNVGHDGNGFCFDNELPRHKQLLNPFAISNRLVTNGEFLEFMESGGYERPEFWLSMGHSVAKENHWQAPLYWQRKKGEWHHFTLHGFVPVDENQPVTHISFFEADAYANWKGHRLATEAEWELTSRQFKIDGRFVESGDFHPGSASNSQQFFGDCWEWTSSQYSAYPGYKPHPGAIGEYNGKFMCNQFVLRGGSCVTSQSHIRPTYRNFFPPETRWQFSGIRLATDA